MTLHLSARLAWHMDGWNGRVCKEPANNTHCVGTFSYPGDMIKQRRNLPVEETIKGQCCTKLKQNQIPPCVYSINAFGNKEITAFSPPPDFFNDATTVKYWSVPPATICTWPYEEMYGDDVKTEQGYWDNEARLEKAQEYFELIEPDNSLIFYYANYSNPFSEEDDPRYVIVGLSRVKEVGEEMFYENCSQQTKKKFAGGFLWQRNITSHYPDEGFRIPYHLYMDRPEVLEQILFVPDNERNFKYATRMFSDDDALELVERFLEIAETLHSIGDTSEYWPVRISWLQSLIAELWQSRGLYPGLDSVLDYLDFQSAIPYFKEMVNAGEELAAKEAIFDFLQGNSKTIPDLTLAKEEKDQVLRQWRLKSPEEQTLLCDILSRIDLDTWQIECILSEDRAANGIYYSLEQIIDNPYIISEEFIGADANDMIPFSKIDHGVFPLPNLGGEFWFRLDDWRRLRGLIVERLRRESKHTFVAAARVVHDINLKLSFMPEWKSHQFNERYLKVDETALSQALEFRSADKQLYIYLKTVYQDERSIEKQVRALAKGRDINFRKPVNESHWYDFIHNSESELARLSSADYEEAIKGQIEVCQQIFTRPICVLSGAAGTGKTTVIKALIQAIDRAHNRVSFLLLAPTGKAAERLREVTGKQAKTIHSFLAQRGWLNENMTFKRAGGQCEESINTYIIDESSMLDLSLTATLFRAINWATVQRLIFVGDPNQLPPIGRGRVFADIIDYLKIQSQENVGLLTTNIRQMENRITGKGTGILELASLYIRTDKAGEHEPEKKAEAEATLRRVQEGGDVAPDLRVIYWDDPADLSQKLFEAIKVDLASDMGKPFNEDQPYKLWREFFNAYKAPVPDRLQVITPYRNEQFGTEFLNTTLQKLINGKMLERVGNMAGITLFDKVIQIVNRPKSNPVLARNKVTGKDEKIEVYNGEIGFALPNSEDDKNHSNGWSLWLQKGFRIERCQVIFSRKPTYRVEVKKQKFIEENLELAYAISVHKAQGSEFNRVYFVVPKQNKALLSRELFYTGLTRASQHCTLFVQEDISPLLSMRRPESSHLIGINSSLFTFQPIPNELQNIRDWYQEGKIHQTLADVMVRSKSEVIIANMLFEREIPFSYEMPLYSAKDGTFYLPDFTINWRGEEWYWEHLGKLDQPDYKNHWHTKHVWYKKNFPGQLITTVESGDLSHQANQIIEQYFS